ERHKWHINKLELIMRLMENGNLDVDQVSALRNDIKYYVDSNQDPDFAEDEGLYDELNLDEEVAEDMFGMNVDNDRLSSQETASIQDDTPEVRSKADSTSGPSGRRPSAPIKSPMPAPATLHPPSASTSAASH